MSPSRFFRIASIAVLVAIWIFSFLPEPAMPVVPGSDKWHHALAYFTCTYCWGQWFTLPASRRKLAITFILMGALIECLQGLTTYRSFDWLDMVANAVGVIIGWVVVTLQLAMRRRYPGLDRPPPA